MTSTIDTRHADVLHDALPRWQRMPTDLMGVISGWVASMYEHESRVKTLRERARDAASKRIDDIVQIASSLDSQVNLARGAFEMAVKERLLAEDRGYTPDIESAIDEENAAWNSFINNQILYEEFYFDYVHILGNIAMFWPYPGLDREHITGYATIDLREEQLMERMADEVYAANRAEAAREDYAAAGPAYNEDWTIDPLVPRGADDEDDIENYYGGYDEDDEEPLTAVDWAEMWYERYHWR